MGHIFVDVTERVHPDVVATEWDSLAWDEKQNVMRVAPVTQIAMCANHGRHCETLAADVDFLGTPCMMWSAAGPLFII
eukprot:13927792-Heterocapsa_arctica.AAC.1